MKATAEKPTITNPQVPVSVGGKFHI